MDKIVGKWKLFKQEESEYINGKQTRKWIEWYVNGNLLNRNNVNILMENKLENRSIMMKMRKKEYNVNILMENKLENGINKIKMGKKRKKMNLLMDKKRKMIFLG